MARTRAGSGGSLDGPQLQPRWPRAGGTETVRLALCALAVLLGAMVMAGWLLSVEPLKAVVPGFSTMKFNTALGFILAGAGLAAIPYGRPGRMLAAGCAVTLLLVGGATLFEFASGRELGVDQLLVADRGSLRGSGHPGRMSPLTAMAWTALGASLLLLALSQRRQGIILAHLLVLSAGFVSFLSAAGYAFGAAAFWGIGRYTSIAVHTAVGLSVVAAAGLMTRANEGWLEPFRQSPAARALLTRMLPLSLALPFFLGLLILLGSGMGAYNAPYGFALFIPTIALALVLVSLGEARRLRRGEIELRRNRLALRRSEERLRALNETLEQRILTEVAERTKAEEALRQSQKLESIGQLTGGVAHDFNNLLTPIIGSLDLLRRRAGGDERARRLLDGALQSAERARTLVQRLLAFARRQPLQRGPVDLTALIGSMAELIASTSGPRIRLEVDLAPGLPPVVADANQLEMAILNLSVNARDAMPEGGVLTIAGSIRRVEAGHRSGLEPGDYVRISVADTGAGMDEEVLARAVEPFFSTKGVGHGTGLGLSMVHGLMAQLGGMMTLESRVGLGTCVELWLPRAEGDAAPAASEAERGTQHASTGTALVVDDEPLVRASIAEMVADLGFAVIEAESAAEALKRLDAGACPDLLVTDHLMPGMTGTELARIARARMPRLITLIVSGYAELDEIAPDLPRLTKPFRQEALAEMIERLREGGERISTD